MEQLSTLQSRIDRGDPEGLRRFLDALDPVEAALQVSRLDEERRARLLSIISPGRAAAMVEQIPDAQAAEAMEQLEPAVAAAILDELPSAERADLLGDMPEEAADAILDRMTGEHAEATRSLRSYPDDVAGGLMMLEYLAYTDTATVGTVLGDLRAHAAEYGDFVVQYVFVITADKTLVGVLRLRDLLFNRPEVPIRELMMPEPLSVRDTDALDTLRAFFEKHPFYGVPVVDEAGRLVGIVRQAAVQEALADRSEDAYLKTQGIVGEELRSMPLLRRSRRRLAWLSANIVLNVIAASVIAMYQETLAAVIALAVFLPIISDMSGCSGNQAVAVSMRELTLGVLRPREVWRVWRKEVSVGAINGLALGILIAAVAWAWKGNPFLGAVVGVAMLLNTMVAVSIGGIVPLLLKRAGTDPALASGPILTTITDMCGFFLLLSIASLALPLLTG